MDKLTQVIHTAPADEYLPVIKYDREKETFSMILRSIVLMSSIMISSGQVVWNPQFKELACSSDITIDVAWSFANEIDLMLGVDASTPLPKNTVKVALASLIPPPRKANEKAVFVEDGMIESTDGCNLSVSGLANASRRYALQLILQSGRRILMRINGKTSIDFKVGEGAVIYEGQPIVDRGALYVTRGFATSYLKGSNSKAAPEVFAGVNGKYFATSSGLKSHISANPPIPLPSQSSPCCSSLTLTSFKITVQKDGSITDIEIRSASKELADRIIPLLQACKFKPFYVGSSVVIADAILSVAAGPKGELFLVL